MTPFIYVIRKINYQNPTASDYKFFDKQVLTSWLKVAAEKCEISEYKYGFIDPKNENLYIHELDSKTIEILMSEQ